MKPFTVIPQEDIKAFLLANQHPITSNMYSDAWDLMQKNNTVHVIPAISDYLISQNLSQQDILNLPMYKLSKILLSSTEDLPQLGQLVNINKESIIRILGYINHLENDMNIFDIIPSDISSSIINKLDIYSVKMICEI